MSSLQKLALDPIVAAKRNVYFNVICYSHGENSFRPCIRLFSIFALLPIFIVHPCCQSFVFQKEILFPFVGEQIALNEKDDTTLDGLCRDRSLCPV